MRSSFLFFEKKGLTGAFSRNISKAVTERIDTRNLAEVKILMLEIEIANYVVWLQQETRDYQKHSDVPVMAIITAIPKDEGLAARPSKFYFVFVDSDEIPNNYIEGREVFVFIPCRFYVNYLDLLRNEKPIKVLWDRDKATCQLATGRREPVGEGPGENPRL